jgi:DNA-binding LytR/AlgR family response regulator
MKLRCLLIDDEPPALKVLESHMLQVNGLEIVGLCRNAIEALDILHQRPVDVLFLDIKMPKLLGTDFLRNLSHPPQVIFVTAYRDYAIESYELDAVDYLVKPVSFERFVKAVSKLKRMTAPDKDVQTSDYSPNPRAFVYLKVDKNMQKVFVNEILYIESWKDYVKLFITGDKIILVKQPISSMENLLSAHRFVRVHRSYIVSIDKISGYNGLFVQMNKTDIPIGRLYKQAVMERLNGYESQ